ncbi:hypothetical protein ACFLTL_00420 [Chloroflexota bacterium]
MSKFLESLGQASSAATPPMGFRVGAGAQPKQGMLLVAAVADGDEVTELVAGADAGLVVVTGSRGEVFQNALNAAPDIPWGAWVTSGGNEIDRIPEGYDFAVFPDCTAMVGFQGEVEGKVLAVKALLGEGLLRAVDRLPVEAVLMDYSHPEGGVLTWHHLMQVQRSTGLLSKPLLVAVGAGVVAAELQALWAAGVSAVVVEVGKGQTGIINELRRTIESLPPLPQRKQGRLGAIVPMIGGRRSEAAEPEEEPDEESEEE